MTAKLNRIVIIGAGAIGGIAGGYLSRAGKNVHLIDNDPEVVKAVKKGGLEILSSIGSFKVKVPISRNILDFPWQDSDFIILSVKTQHAYEAIGQAADAAGHTTPICCFQNSVHNEVMASRRFKYVYGASILYSGNNLEPGRRFYTEGDTAEVGVYPSGPVDDNLRWLADQFKGTDIKLVLIEDVMAAKYAKLIINMANAPCAILGLTDGALMNTLEPRRLFDDLQVEAKRVLDGASIKYDKSHLTYKPPDIKAIPKSVQKGFEVWCSTHQDLIAHRPDTEVDFLNGEIVALGKRYGIPTPLNEVMVRLMHQLSYLKEPSGKYSVADIRRMALSDE